MGRDGRGGAEAASSVGRHCGVPLRIYKLDHNAVQIGALEGDGGGEESRGAALLRPQPPTASVALGGVCAASEMKIWTCSRLRVLSCLLSVVKITQCLGVLSNQFTSHNFSTGLQEPAVVSDVHRSASRVQTRSANKAKGCVQSGQKEKEGNKEKKDSM
ncbi:hypothetical protein ZIOFF_071205 [Zingiber officinale]|uniref:Uncharacterized protein n=1 Tax=Zingiber officinale TaxID=94328 RepID=A0A8J5EQB6_ZINOF|nr:hypothetical protein ZIOFF_071205 [Zingiber officinale]